MTTPATSPLFDLAASLARLESQRGRPLDEETLAAWKKDAEVTGLFENIGDQTARQELDARRILELIANLADLRLHLAASCRDYEALEAKYEALVVVPTLRPRTVADALDLQWAAQASYETASAAASAAHRAWSATDVGGSRVRRSAVKRLMETGLSATAADKAASDDETYAAHKDAVAQLLDAKLDAEAARDGALQRLLSARSTVDALAAGF